MANKVRQINTEIADRPDPDWLDPPRPCGHEWRNNDFICMDCVEARIERLETANTNLQAEVDGLRKAAFAALINIQGMLNGDDLPSMVIRDMLRAALYPNEHSS